MGIISRAQWGAEAPSGSLTPWHAGQPSSWTIHWEGTWVNPGQPDYTSVVRSIQHYHKTHGYVDIAYSFAVAPNGQIYEGRGWGNQSAAQMGGNPYSLAICYLGGPGNPFTAQGKASINWLIAQRPMTVYPHRHWFNTECPGAEIVNWIAAGRDGGGPSAPPPAAPSPPPAVGQSTLQLGSRGPAVTVVQARLSSIGYHLVLDGIFGPATLAAVRAFQASRGLTVDGIVGSQTYAALAASAPPAPRPAPTPAPSPAGGNPTIARGATGAAVRQLQIELNTVAGRGLVADGIFGPATDAAVRDFQRFFNLGVDGIVGPRTWGMLDFCFAARR